MEIHSSKVVCGDIVIIEEGMNIPCDGMIVKANSVTCDESAMTGESILTVKDTVENCWEAK